MAWRVAESLEKLRAQLNEAFPKRSKVSDGGIGDAAHASRNSDHNPYIKVKGVGIVRARDFTHDPRTGIDCQWLADTLTKNRDPRIRYLIWNRQICSSEKQPWVWRKYTGVNAHTKHLHISVSEDPKLFDSKKEWKLDFVDPDDEREQDDTAKVVADDGETSATKGADSSEGQSVPEPPPATVTEATATSVTSKTTTTQTDDAAGKTKTVTEETPNLFTRIKTSTTFAQALGINVSAVLMGAFAYLQSNYKVMLGTGAVIVAVYFIYNWREAKRGK